MKKNVFSPGSHAPNIAWIIAVLQLAASLSFAAAPATSAVPAPSRRTLAKGTLYDLASHRENPLFYYERTETSSPEKRVDAWFKDPKGTVAVSEKVLYGSGKPLRYEYEQHQTHESGSVEFKEKRYRVTFTSSEGKTRSDEQDRADNVVVGPLMMDYLDAHWSDLLRGEDIVVRIIVLDRLDTFGFRFSLDGEETIDGKSALRVKLKPTSFFVSAVVSPIYFYFEKQSRKLLLMKGRTLLRYERDGDMHDLIAETVFQ